MSVIHNAELDKARDLVGEGCEIWSVPPVIRDTGIPVHDIAASVAAGLPMAGSWRPIPGFCVVSPEGIP